MSSLPPEIPAIKCFSNFELCHANALPEAGKPHPSALPEFHSWISGDKSSHFARGANETLRNGKLAPFSNHLAPFGRSRCV